MAMNKIPGHDIYIGGILAVKNKAALSRTNVTHIVSVLRLNQPDETFAGYQHHCIDADDVEDENLLEHFPAAIKFIQAGLDAGGSVLVHCAMGKSRSATICIAYLLHRQRSGLNVQSALALIRQGRPLCEPNDGFMEQLSIYHEMGCPDNVTEHPLYNRWLYRREVEDSVACGRAPEMQSILFEDEQPQRPEETSDRTTEIKCRKCRRTLATTPFIIPHGQKSNGRSTDCAHIFLHPLTWMRPSLFPNTTADPPASEYGSRPDDAPLSGRLTCPNTACGANIGKFAWQGMQCSCGEWVVPAIGLAKARVDMSERFNMARGPGNRPPAAFGIRMPPGMRSPGEESGTGRGNL
ncbi:dual specificity phosphatase YVH1 [Aspergillus clavatus NRRL 1]|uniref:protein-tyrosine-phosphatase n=1 Tax=Aspergillus clavatus (strain ATCC 1007 / CBS 513.65 / DSM 816 / NCTC 3887 / NRRL 1 / QM 1276 / 107) TaxID=344612 RepID=A1CH18_ASPCL|nr:dual specificity phosphatase, putative [Aspergillus clavatus NRRL 1]EAW10173.1 dual specificity phosphatase, putative [Aspergillus clavatus NRRL 1]